MHAWDNTGVPEHPAGLLDITVLVCVLFDWHVDHAEYVYTQARGAAGLTVTEVVLQEEAPAISTAQTPKV